MKEYYTSYKNIISLACSNADTTTAFILVRLSVGEEPLWKRRGSLFRYNFITL